MRKIKYFKMNKSVNEFECGTLGFYASSVFRALGILI